MDELFKGKDYVRTRKKKPASVVEKKVKDALKRQRAMVSFPPH